jgi:predicted RNase H-like HicB family nuclease
MSKTTLNINLPVSILREGKAFVAYSPALDLSTAGKSFDEAINRFDEAVQIFFEEMLEEGNGVRPVIIQKNVA